MSKGGKYNAILSKYAINEASTKEKYTSKAAKKVHEKKESKAKKLSELKKGY